MAISITEGSRMMSSLRQKRYEYWASNAGRPEKKFTSWFKYDGPKEPYQLDKKLKNEYREI